MNQLPNGKRVLPTATRFFFFFFSSSASPPGVSTVCPSQFLVSVHNSELYVKSHINDLSYT